MKALVFSSGGSKSAFSGGITEYPLRIVVLPMNYL
jgi:hypothetical protein